MESPEVSLMVVPENMRTQPPVVPGIYTPKINKVFSPLVLFNSEPSLTSIPVWHPRRNRDIIPLQPSV